MPLTRVLENAKIKNNKSLDYLQKNQKSFKILVTQNKHRI